MVTLGGGRLLPFHLSPALLGGILHLWGYHPGLEHRSWSDVVPIIIMGENMLLWRLCISWWDRHPGGTCFCLWKMMPRTLKQSFSYLLDRLISRVGQAVIFEMKAHQNGWKLGV